MGYDLHITRRKYWADSGNDIPAEEWLEYVANDRELKLAPENGPYFAVWKGGLGEEWLDWADGQIYSKNPSAAFIEKMVSIAGQLGATVQGDDGEIYESATGSPRQPKRSLWDWIIYCFARLQRRRRVKTAHKCVDFNLGDKVYDVWGNEHVVVSIEPEADHGLGIIRTRRCSDGVELGHYMIAHGLSRSPPVKRPKQST